MTARGASAPALRRRVHAKPSAPVTDTYRACSIVEGFSGEDHSEEERLEAWQYLIDTGACWTLQGWYGRTAAALIQAGECHAKGAA